MKWAIWTGLRFDLRSIVLALGVKMYWGQAPFSNLKFFYNNFRSIGTTATSLKPSCFSRWKKNRVILHFAKKSQVWPTAHFGVIGQIRSKLVILGIIRFGAKRQTLWYPFHLSITFGLKVMCRIVIFPIELYNGLCRKFTWSEVTKLKNAKYTFGM